MEKQKAFLRIPDYLIRNNGVIINATDFALLCILKQQSFLSKNATFNVDSRMLRQALCVGDTRTLKKSLLALKQIGVITSEILMPKRGPMTITLSDSILNATPFTRLPTGILRRLEKIGHVGLRLLFYYESHINRTSVKTQFCFSSFKTITDRLKIGDSTLSNYNDVLEKEKLLTVKKDVLHTDYEYTTGPTGEDRLVSTKYNNHYTPMIEKM